MHIQEQRTARTGQKTERTEDVQAPVTLFVEYYTDPLCSWSWAFEACWRRLRSECVGRLAWRYRMGGLISDWRSYDDPFNDIHHPAQMGPQWVQVRELSGMPLDERLWQEDPPASSYPACIAVKAAERQGEAIAERYLRRLREAVMLEGRNIARREILLAVAQETAQASTAGASLDLDRFYQDLEEPGTAEAFRQDLREASYHGLGRFPTLLLLRPDGRGIVLVGYRPYHVLCEALDSLAPGLRQGLPLSQEELIVSLVHQWERITARELAEVSEGQVGPISELLDALVKKGKLGLAEDSQGQVPLYMPAR